MHVMAWMKSLEMVAKKQNYCCQMNIIQKSDDNVAKVIAARNAEVERIQSLNISQQQKIVTSVTGVDLRTGEVLLMLKRIRIMKDLLFVLRIKLLEEDL